MTAGTVFLSWSTSRLLAIVIVAVVIGALGGLTAQAGAGVPKRGGLVNGLDNRWSTSKLSVLLWTIAILWAFVALLLHYAGSAVPSHLPAAYFALLGLPSTGALGAKAVASRPNDTKITLDQPTSQPLTGLGQIFCDDSGALDLLDTQYFLFNLVLLAYFVAGFWQIAAPKPDSTTIILPSLPGPLLVLSGVSTATYLGKKVLGSGARTRGL